LDFDPVPELVLLDLVFHLLVESDKFRVLVPVVGSHAWSLVHEFLEDFRFLPPDALLFLREQWSICASRRATEVEVYRHDTRRVCGRTHDLLVSPCKFL